MNRMINGITISDLHFFKNVSSLKDGWICPALFVLFLIFLSPDTKAQNKESAIKNEADKYFDSGDFFRAQEEYKKLIKLNPKDIIYNAKYGVCLLNTDSVKSTCLKYLSLAANQQDASSLCIFYYAKALHMNCKFDEAIAYYQKFSTQVLEKDIVLYDINRQIEMCKNGKVLLGKMADIEFFGKIMVNRDKFPLSDTNFLKEVEIYNVSDEFKSEVDKTEKFNSVMCLYDQETGATYSSYGKLKTNGKDLCRRVKFADEWSMAKPFDEVNTFYDEDFPIVTEDGSQIYFSSMGHNSMGGYDIFKSIWNRETDSWSKPENLGFPINSPFDDMLFIPIKERGSACFTSDRNSPFGKLEIFRIKYPMEIGDLSLVKGQFHPYSGSRFSKARITVVNITENKLEGIFYSDEKTGEYLLALTPGRKFSFSIQMKEFSEHIFSVDVPLLEKKFIYKQVILSEKNMGTESIIAFNFFKEEEANMITGQILKSLSDPKREKELLEILKGNTVLTKSVISVINEAEEDSSVLALVDRLKEKKVENEISAMWLDQDFLLEEKEKLSEAEKAFMSSHFETAIRLYSELLLYRPYNGDYNYKAGMCLLNVAYDRSIAIPFLRKASRSTSPPNDVFFNLARIFHLNGHFDESVEYYKRFSKNASSLEMEKLKIVRRIENCSNAKEVSNLAPSAEIIFKKADSTDSVIKSFHTFEYSGKILFTPDELRSSFDKKNGFSSTMYLSDNNNEAYYASYGVDGKTGKDIYKRVKLPSGQWGQPQYLKGINTPYDEDYPFIAYSGNIYFSSQGHNSMGGFDIFKAELLPGNQSWSKPVNLGEPVNSPGDDIFFIRCKDGESVYFSSDRNSLSGKMEIFNARMLNP